MNDEAGKGIDAITGRIDELVREVRRQGRAAIAAQAAAESCLEAVLALRAESPSPSAATEPPSKRDGAQAAPAKRDELWIRSLVPSLDGLDRILGKAASLSARRAAGTVGRWIWPFRKPAERDGELESIAEGLRVLRAELASALVDLGVTIDRREGVVLDAERHRVVEVRPPRAGEATGAVAEVVRPGYAIGDRLVREADVVAIRGDHRGN